jgi:hypothetical protein
MSFVAANVMQATDVDTMSPTSHPLYHTCNTICGGQWGQACLLCLVVLSFAPEEFHGAAALEDFLPRGYIYETEAASSVQPSG